MIPFAAWLYAALTAVACLFQLALAAGMPWGHLAMGGKFPGRFPPRLRVAAVIQMLLLAAFALVVLARAELALPSWHAASKTLVWVVVPFTALSVVANLATPSRQERMLWAPVTLLLFGSVLTVALA